MSGTRLVFDTGPLSHFARGGWLGVIPLLAQGATAVVPEAVARELMDGRHAYAHLGAVLNAHWLSIDRSDDASYVVRTARYEARLAAGGRNHGECAVLALAGVRGWTAVVDDAEARKIAREDDIAYVTSLKLLCDAIKSDLVTTATCGAIVEDLLRTEYRLPFTSVAEFWAWARQHRLLE